LRSVLPDQALRKDEVSLATHAITKFENTFLNWNRLSREVAEAPSLEVFKKTCRCGTSGYGLVGMVVLGEWLDLMILQVFYNL